MAEKTPLATPTLSPILRQPSIENNNNINNNMDSSTPLAKSSANGTSEGELRRKVILIYIKGSALLHQILF